MGILSSYKDKSALEELYIEKDMSMVEVGEELGCSADTVSRWVNKFDIETGRLTDEQRNDISITDYQHQLIKGTLMGDGSISRRDNPDYNPQYLITMKNKEFIEWLFGELKPLASSVRRRKGEYADTLDNQQTTLRTYSHECLREYADWYESGKKRWPVEEKLSELELKMLYVTDGSIVNSHCPNPAAKISAINEADRKDEVSDMFKESLGIDISWHSSDRNTDGVIYIPSKYATMIWNQDPVPGFGYKWPGGKYWTGEDYWEQING